MVKLRQSHTSDIEQVRKAVRAAIVLIPLLGITNILNMTESPLHRSPIEFALWSYTTHFLVSFQGFFIATIYCFLNNEVNERRMKKSRFVLRNLMIKITVLLPQVRAALIKSIGVYMSLRGHLDWLPRRHSMFSGAYATAPDTELPCNDINNR